jgi:hypothetical protein
VVTVAKTFVNPVARMLFKNFVLIAILVFTVAGLQTVTFKKFLNKVLLAALINVIA